MSKHCIRTGWHGSMAKIGLPRGQMSTLRVTGVSTKGLINKMVNEISLANVVPFRLVVGVI